MAPCSLLAGYDVNFFFNKIYIIVHNNKVVHNEFGFCMELKKGVSYNTGRHTF